MQRDKRGRFIKKALDGTTLTLNGKSYKVKEGAQQAYEAFKGTYNSMEAWLGSTDGQAFLEETVTTPITTETDPQVITTPTPGSLNNPTFNFTSNYKTYTPGSLTFNTSFDYNQQNAQTQALDAHSAFGLSEQFSPERIQLTSDALGSYKDPMGRSVSMFEISANPHRYEILHDPKPEQEQEQEQEQESEEESAGMNFVRTSKPKQPAKNNNINIINKTKLADYLEYARAGLGYYINNKIADKALEAEKPFLQDVSESHRTIQGDYRAQIEGEKAAAKLRNMASTPLTSDGALQQQMMMEAQIKGQEYIDQGNAQDDAAIKQSRELAWQQEKENQQQRQAVAMQNKQAILMSEKNKAQIENARDSANYSQVIAPLLGAKEQRLRNDGAKQDYYQDYYNDALVDSDVWHTFETTLTPEQQTLRQEYINGGLTGLKAYINGDTTKQNEWLKLKQIMDNEIIRRKAAIKGVNINPGQINTVEDPYAAFRGSSMDFKKKKGGTIYKAKLTKRTKDNDRGAKSIESSKKIAARFLEKAIDSLYDYSDVELIAKPSKKKKRKYQAGGGLPFVNFTPVFATSEVGTPKEAEAKVTKKGEDLTTKDLLELLKDVDGLPSDIDVIQEALSDFVIMDTMDPLGLDSTSSIAARYMSVITKIKKAKANREWYDKAYDQLSKNGALNEYAIDSTGHFIGMNSDGDFARFTASQVAEGQTSNYQLLTNSNLLDIRARYPNAAFNSNLIMEAANGVSMAQINEHISKIIQGLGSDKSQTQIFGDQSKEVLAGLKQLQAAAQQVGQDLSISQLYEASIFTESQARQAEMALSYIYQTLPSNMQALLFAKSGSTKGVYELINNLVNSKLSQTTKLEFDPKTVKKGSGNSKTGNIVIDGLELSPAQMLQQGYGERETITIQNASSTGLQVNAITMPITKNGNQPIGAGTLEDVATSQYGGILNFTHASMGGQIIPFEGRRNIAVDGSKIYSMYLPIDQEEYYTRGNIIPDIDLIDKVNQVNKKIKEQQITDPTQINAIYEDAGLPVYLNDNGTVVPTNYRRFGVLNGTAIDNAFGKTFVESRYLKKVDDDDVINNALKIMNNGRSKEDRVEYDAKNFFNFGGLLGEYDNIYQGTIFIPMSNDIFLGIAGSGSNINSTEALDLAAQQQQHERVSATYKNPGQLR